MLGYPLTPLYGMLYIAVAIYVYHWMLKRLSRPMERRWMQTNRSVFFLAMLGCMWLAVLLAILTISVVSVAQYLHHPTGVCLSLSTRLRQTLYR